MAAKADYTPADLDLLLRRRSHTPIPFAFTDEDGPVSLVGYTQPKLLVAAKVADDAVEIAGSIVSASGGTASVTIDAAAWTALAAIKSGVWQFQALNASAQLVILVGGKVTIEDSLT